MIIGGGGRLFNHIDEGSAFQIDDIMYSVNNNNYKKQRVFVKY